MAARRYKVKGGPRTFRTNDKAKARLHAKSLANAGNVAEVVQVLTGRTVARFTPDDRYPLGWREERFE